MRTHRNIHWQIRSFLFPFVSVVEVPQDEILDRIGLSLVVTAITEDEVFIHDLLGSPEVERLNIGPHFDESDFVGSAA